MIPSRTSAPRLFALVLVGAALLVLGAATALVDPLVGAATGVLGFRIGFLGFLLLVFGVAGYVAIGVFQRRPEP